MGPCSPCSPHRPRPLSQHPVYSRLGWVCYGLGHSGAAGQHGPHLGGEKCGALSTELAHGRSHIRAFGGKTGAPPRTLKAQGGKGHTTLPYFEWAHHLGSMMLFRNSPRGVLERETRPWQDHTTLSVGSRPTHAAPEPARGTHPSTARR